MDGLLGFLNNVWPVFGAIALVGLITYGAMMPYIRKDRARQKRMENSDD